MAVLDFGKAMISKYMGTLTGTLTGADALSEVAMSGWGTVFKVFTSVMKGLTDKGPQREQQKIDILEEQMLADKAYKEGVLADKQVSTSLGSQYMGWENPRAMQPGWTAAKGVTVNPDMTLAPKTQNQASSRSQGMLSGNRPGVLSQGRQRTV